MTTSISFPDTAIVGSIGDLARALADGTEVPVEFYYAAALTILGAICSTGLKLNIGFDTEPRLYTVLLGESYSVKKSTAMKKTIEFFSRVNKPDAWNPFGIVYGVGSAEGLARELSSHSTTLLAYDELRAFVDKCHVKGSTLLPMVTSLFEQTHWHNATKSRKASLTVDDAHLSLLSCCTMDTYSDIWKQDAIAIGLPNRLFVVNADQRAKVAWPSKPDEAQLSLLAERIRAQISRCKAFDITPDGKEAWEVWYKAAPNSEHSRRLDTIGFRLLALIALATDKDMVDAETVQTVTSILKYEFDLRMLTDPIDADSTIAQLEEKVRRQLRGKGSLSPRDLQQAVNAHRLGCGHSTRRHKIFRGTERLLFPRTFGRCARCSHFCSQRKTRVN